MYVQSENKKIKLCNLSSPAKNMLFIPRIRILDSLTNTFANLEMEIPHTIYLSENQQVDRNYS